MSWQATAWVSTVEAGGPSGKLLLYALANYADEHGRCFPGDERIMSDTELSERSVRDWKRRLEEAGLIRVERRRKPGGDFDVDVIQLAMGGNAAVAPPAKSAGGTTGKSCRHHRQMAPSPPANGSIPPTPPYIAEPSKEPSEEPQRETRADGKDGQAVVDGPVAQGEDRRKVEATFWRLAKAWPGFDGMPKAPALKAWTDLAKDDRAEAERMFPHWLSALRAQKRSHIPSPSTYFRERLWREVAEPREVKPVSSEAKPFGPLWQAARLKALLAGPTRSWGGPTVSLRRMIEAGITTEERLLREWQEQSGFPAINAMHDRAATRQGVVVSLALEPLAAGMEAVPVGSAVWEAWRAEHARRAWPWLPDPGRLPVVWFPAGGPEGLAAFERAVAEVGASGAPRRQHEDEDHDDAAGRTAAE
jgi:hypothetical protein